jgi:nitrogenase molybdenum-iron protein NifN
MGIPTFDRLGAPHLVSIGYRGTRDLVFAIGNVFAGESHEPEPDTWRHAWTPTFHATDQIWVGRDSLAAASA